jgi:hypothetical protein
MPRWRSWQDATRCFTAYSTWLHRASADLWLLLLRPQAGGLLVEVADLGGAGTEGLGQERADGLEFCQRLVGVAVGG